MLCDAYRDASVGEQLASGVDCYFIGLSRRIILSHVDAYCAHWLPKSLSVIHTLSYYVALCHNCDCTYIVVNCPFSFDLLSCDYFYWR